MKTRAFFLQIVLLSILGITATYGQDTVPEVKLWTIYPGYVVTNSGDTIRGYVKLNNLVDNQEKALFYKDPSDKKYTEKYKPKDIKGYKTGPREYESFKFWPGGGAANTYHFFLRLVDGPIKYYRWYYEPETRTQKRFVVDDNGVKIDLSFDEKDLHYEEIAKKLDEKPVKIGLKYKSVMSKLVKEDKELADKIIKKEKGYTIGNTRKIIEEYNKWYKAHK